MVHGLQRAVPVPALQVAVHRAARRQVAGQVSPLATGLQHVEQTVHDLAHHHRTAASAALGGPDQRRDQRPLGIRQVARVAQPITPVAIPIGRCPHRKNPRRFQPGSCGKPLKSRKLFVDGL
jgi:hypothetical protein